jgi:hypothetical protein
VFSLVLSAIGALFLLSIVVQSPVSPPEVTLTERGLIGGGFILLCFIGISFALRPNWMKAAFLQKNGGGEKSTNTIKRRLRGHHPDCPVFDSHRIVSQKRVWCAGCLGLLLGCVFSMVLMMLYVVVPFQSPLSSSRLLFVFGLFMTILGDIESVRMNRHASVHVLFSGLLILGFLFITVSIVRLSGEFIYGFYTLLLCLLWLDTRIQLSKWHHSRLCRLCPNSCKI